MASRLQDVILRGPAASKPLATTVAPGTLYYSSNTFLTERSNGTSWESFTDGGTGSGINQLTGDVLAGPGNGVQSATLATVLANPGSYVNTNLTVDAKGRITAINSGATGAGSSTAFGCEWDGGGAVPTVGVTRYLEIPFPHTISAAIMLADVAGSAVVDVWRDIYNNAPPTAADSICASAKPTLVSAIKSKDTTLTGWTLGGLAGDVYGFRLDSASVLTFVRLSLTVVRA